MPDEQAAARVWFERGRFAVRDQNQDGPRRASRGSYRSFLALPIFREGTSIGVVGCGPRAVRPFTPIQITLLETFADQAVIALENARLFDEIESCNRDLRGALERQTATPEVLQVINASPADLAPVFDRMLKQATQLCEARFGFLRAYDGEHFHPAAVHGLPAAFPEFLGRSIDLADSPAPDAVGYFARPADLTH